MCSKVAIASPLLLESIVHGCPALESSNQDVAARLWTQALPGRLGTKAPIAYRASVSSRWCAAIRGRYTYPICHTIRHRPKEYPFLAPAGDRRSVGLMTNAVPNYLHWEFLHRLPRD